MRHLHYLLLTALLSMTASAAMAADASDIITEAKGQKKVYSLAANTFSRENNWTAAYYNGIYSEIWFDDDNTVYMKNPIVTLENMNYLKGVIDGNTITFTMPQVIGKVDRQLFYAGRCLATTNAYGVLYNSDTQDTTITFNIAEDGTISMTDYGKVANYPKVVIGALLPNGNSYRFYTHSSSGIVLTPLSDAITALPAGVQAEEWILTSNNQPGQAVKVAVSGNDIWFTPFPELFPGVYVKGTIADGKAVFNSRQFIGSQLVSTPNNPDCNEIRIATHFAGASKSGDNIEQMEALTFDYNPNSKALISNEVMVLANGEKVLHSVEAPQMQCQMADVEYTDPVAPKFIDALPYLDTLKNGYITFEIQNIDTEGHVFDSNQAYYNLFVDGMPYTFDRNTYQGIPEQNMVNVPFNLNDGKNFVMNGNLRTVTFFVKGTPKLGLRTVFTDPKGKQHVSELVEFEIANLFPNGIEYNNCRQNNLTTYGTGKKETYDAAILINDPSLIGHHITGVKIPVVDSDNIEYTIWLSKKLNSGYENDVNVNLPDIEEVKATNRAGMLYARFSKPYLIDEEGVFVGYTAKVNSLDDITAAPLVVAEGSLTGGLYLHSSRSFLKWSDQSANKGAILAMSAIVDGKFNDNAAGVNYVYDIDLELDTPGKGMVTIANHGLKPISNVNYTWKVADKQGRGMANFNPAIEGNYNRRGIFSFDIPGITEKGTHELEVTITKVNGEDNNDPSASGIGYVNILFEEPVHRAVIEEYTGTWCGWCPRGLVGMELMAEKYPDEFIGVAYHDKDPMTMAAGYPDMADGFPLAWIDRVVQTDPYHGNNPSGFGVDNLWKERCNVIAPCHVDISAHWLQEGIIEATTTTRFVKTSREEYRLSYLLIADGLTGDTSKWAQVNYFCAAGHDAYDGKEGMDRFVNGTSPMSGIKFNDVAIYTSGFYGIEGSLYDTTPFEDRQHVYEFMTDYARSATGENLVQDPDKLRVVVMVLRFPQNPDGTVSQYGEIVNAAMCKLLPLGVDETTGIPADVTYYNLSGSEVRTPAPGIYVKKTTFTDGTCKSEKVVIR